MVIIKIGENFMLSVAELLRRNLTDGYGFRFRKLLHDFKGRDGREIEFVDYIKKRAFESTLLMAGYPKSGNTYFRFVYFHLLNQVGLECDGEKVLSYDDLNGIQFHTIENYSKEPPEYKELPLFYRTHNLYYEYYRYFKLVYLYRNPLDCMVSMYHFKEKDRPWRNDPMSFKSSLRFYFPQWCYNVKSYIGKTPYMISYESMMRRPYDVFYGIFSQLGLEFSMPQLERSLELSSFDSISRMEDKNGADAMTSADKHNMKFG